ncbi:MAG: histidinol-phosphatase [Firmicutes bacterium]|nr:histidinol-phosphatase [Bacillota bacterium]
MLVDYHLHTVFSGHAVGTIDDYLAKVEELGIEEVCFTEHTSRQYLPDEFRRQIPDSWMQDEELAVYLKLVAAAATRTSVRVKLGLETDYFAGHEEALARFLDSLPLDFVLGTVHFLPMYEMRYISLVDEEPAAFLVAYFDYIKRAIESGLFDSIAHIHLGWQIVPWPSGRAGKTVEKGLAQVVAAAATHDVCLEINTRAFNFEGHGTLDIYRRFMAMIADYGVPITLGSDAHDPKDVGRNYPQVLRTLRHYGIDEVATFEKRQRLMVPVGDQLLSTAQGK